MLAQTLEGVAASASTDSQIFAVLDGCTDDSESIVDSFSRATDVSVEKIRTPDVHEVLSLNEAFRRVRKGYIVCVQDDVVLAEPEFETQIQSLYKEHGSLLGIVSPRHAMNLRRASLSRQLRQSGLVPIVEEFDRVCHPPEAHNERTRVEYGTLAIRMVAGGSPLVIPERIWERLGYLDEAFAPYLWWDHDYSLRALRSGFRNAVFPLRFISEPEWGGMRQDPHSRLNRHSKSISLRNRRYIWDKHGSFITLYLKS